MKRIKSYGKIILGSFLIAAALNLFFVKYKMIPTGIFGFSILYNAKTRMPLALIILLLNIFFFVLGIIFLTKKEIKKTILPFLLIPAFTFLTQDLANLINLENVEQFLLALYGGVIMGLGLQFIYKENSYASGVDIIAQISKKITSDKIYFLHYILDAIWILFAIIIYQFEGAMYSLISIIIIEYIAHRATLGISDSKVFYIITKKDKEVQQYIIEELGYDLTVFDVKGGFLKTKNKVLMTVIPTNDYYKLKEGIKVIDPKSFISITDSYEVINPNRTINKNKKNN